MSLCRLLLHSSNTKYFFSVSEPPSCCARWHRGVWGGGDSRRGAGGFWQRAEAENGDAALEKGRGAQGRVRWAGGEHRGREGGREEGKDILILLSPIKTRPPNAPLVLYSVTLHVTAVGDTECAEWCVVPGLYSKLNCSAAPVCIMELHKRECCLWILADTHWKQHRQRRVLVVSHNHRPHLDT